MNPHRVFAQQGEPPWDAEPRFELGPALQQADALPTELCRILPTELRRILTELRRILKTRLSRRLRNFAALNVPLNNFQKLF